MEKLINKVLPVLIVLLILPALIFAGIVIQVKYFPSERDKWLEKDMSEPTNCKKLDYSKNNSS